MRNRSFSWALAGLVAFLLMGTLSVLPPESYSQPVFLPEAAGPARNLSPPVDLDRFSSLEVAGRSQRDGEVSPVEADEGETEGEQRKPNCAVLDCIALTFDDGPVPGTDRLLNTLQEREVPATFFLIGQQIEEHQRIVERMVIEGHAVGNHSWSHLALTTLKQKSLEAQIDRTTGALTAAGVTDPILLRPPYGDVSESVLKSLRAQGYASVMWNVDPEDWRLKDAGAVERAVTSAAQPGAIILLHDIHDSTIDAVPGIISTLRKQGYTFVTVPELFDDALEPGEIYYRRSL